MTTFLGTALPIIQAPMASVQASRLALAVCEAGALGSLPTAVLGPDALHEELTQMAAQAQGRPWNCLLYTSPSPRD